jgi:hypothetical protein
MERGWMGGLIVIKQRNYAHKENMPCQYFVYKSYFVGPCRTRIDLVVKTRSILDLVYFLIKEVYRHCAKTHSITDHGRHITHIDKCGLIYFNFIALLNRY